MIPSRRRGRIGLAAIAVCLAVVLGVASATRAEAANQPPMVSVTSPADGASYPAGATIPFSATAWDVDGVIQGIEFYVDYVWYATEYSSSHTISLPNAAPGVYTLTAKAYDDAGSATLTSITVTVGSSSDSGNQPPSVSVTSPGTGASYPAGATIPFSATASDADGTVTRLDLYVDSVWYATSFSNTVSISLPNAASGVYTLTAKAWDNAGASTTSAGRTLTVGSPGGSSQPFSVSVTSPANGATYPAGATIPFSATASSAAGISRIELYVDSVWYATAYSSSHGISLPNAAAGVYTLTAKAWDNSGASSTSPGTTLIVGTSSSPPSSAPPSSNQPPIVSLTAPASGATFTAPASIAVSATASDVDGTIAQVEFYANGSLIRTDTSNPYSFSWANVIAGNYALTAVARDNAGATTVSSTRDITVKPANLPSIAVFTPSSNHATAVDRYVLEVFPFGSETTVANPVGTQDLGKPAIINGEITADVTPTILTLAPGNYVATVTAMGSGGSARSAPSPPFTR